MNTKSKRESQEIINLVRSVQIDRRISISLEERVLRLQKEMEKLDVWIARENTLEQLQPTNSRLQANEVKLRELAVEAYKDTRDEGKQFPYGSISERTVVDDTDADHTLSWCIDNLRIALKVDVQLFKGIVKSAPEKFSWIEIKKKPSFGISSKLNKYIETLDNDKS